MRIFFTSLLTFLLLTSPAYALDLGEALKLNQNQTVKSQFDTPGTLLSTILPNLYIIAGVILLFIFIGAGFTIVSSGGNPEQMEKGTQALMGAIIGFVIIFASYWIIQIIQILTGVPILNATLPGIS